MMMSAPPGILAQAIVYIGVVLLALGGLGYSFLKWVREARKAELPTWRRTAANLGFLAVAIQAALLLSFLLWHRISRDHQLLGLWATLIYPTFLVAVPLTLAGKGTSRWWLLSSSVIVFVLGFFLSLTP
jgi:hypothetical protein